MRLGVGHPLRPLALLDLVGLDVAQAIGRTIDAPVPARVDALVAEGALGRKSGRGLTHTTHRSRLAAVEVPGGRFRVRRTDPHRNPSSRDTSRPARSCEPAALRDLYLIGERLRGDRGRRVACDDR
jgi:3-hydroxyacyl-CoA dehydrogenase